MKRALFFLSCSLGALSYETDGNVLKLGETDFDKARQEHPDMLVKFFAPWCGHCKNLAPAYVEAASALNQSGSHVKLAEVDCTIHRPLCQKYEVKGYPTLQYFTKGNEQPTKYASGRSKDAIVSWVNQKVEEAKKAAETPKEQDKKEVKQEQKKQQKKPEEAEAAQSGFAKQGNLYKLTEKTFDAAKKKFDYIFVKFFAPWCGHCKRIAESWAQFANSNTDQKVAIAEVDCTTVGPLCAQNGIQSYPTLKLLVKGNEAVPYKAARTVEAWTSWLAEQKTQYIPGANPQQKQKPATEEL